MGEIDENQIIHPDIAVGLYTWDNTKGLSLAPTYDFVIPFQDCLPVGGMHMGMQLEPARDRLNFLPNLVYLPRPGLGIETCLRLHPAPSDQKIRVCQFSGN